MRMKMFYIIKRHQHYTEMLKTTTKIKKIKAAVHITPFIRHYPKNGWMVDTDPLL